MANKRMDDEVYKDYFADKKAKRPASVLQSVGRHLDSQSHADRVIGKDKKTMGKTATRAVKRKIVERDMEAQRKKRAAAAKKKPAAKTAKKKPAAKKKSAAKKRSY